MNTILRSRAVLIWAILVSTSVSSCVSSLWSSDMKTSDDAEEDVSGPKNVKSSRSKSREIQVANAEDQTIALKQAQIWNRLEDLEEQVRLQKEHIALLEQGLLTGIPPEGLRKKRGLSAKLEKGSLPPSVAVTAKELPPPVLDVPSELGAESDSARSPESYRVRIQVAKDYYQASRFGLAVAELAQIMKVFGPNAGEGEAQLYLGRSYLGLKEYLTARTELETFLKQHADHNDRGLARLELARAYMGLNLRERARRELSDIAKDHAGSEEGDIAANELRNMKGAI